MIKEEKQAALLKTLGELSSRIDALEDNGQIKAIVTDLKQVLMELKKSTIPSEGTELETSIEAQITVEEVEEVVLNESNDTQETQCSDNQPLNLVEDQSPEEEEKEEIQAPEESVTTIEVPTTEDSTAKPKKIKLEITGEDPDPNDLSPTMANLSKTPNPNKNKPNPVKKKVVIAKNGMVGKDYSLELHELSELSDGDLTVHSITGLDRIFLSYNKEQSRISGIPTEPGEFKFKISYSLPLGSGTIDRLDDMELRILINPNPRSLWRDNEPSADEPYPKPHFDFDQQEFDGYSMIAGSLRGRSHAHEGTFRDDDFVLKAIGENVFFMGVADGAGSAKYSREGSKISCDTALATAQLMLEGNIDNIINSAQDYLADLKNAALGKTLNAHVHDLMGETVRKTRNALVEQATKEGHQLRDYSTTLLFSIIFKLEDKYFIMAYGIGDGIIGHVSDAIKLLSNPDGGDFAGQTRFLTMSEAVDSVYKRIKLTFVSDLSGLFLMTDGLTDPFFETDANFKVLRKWEDLNTKISQNIDFDGNTKETMKDWLNFWSPGNHDDRTIAFVRKLVNQNK